MVGIRFGGGPDEILTSCIITPPYLTRLVGLVLGEYLISGQT